MVHKYEPDAIQHRLQVVYANQTRERQTFMQDLKQVRRKKEKQTIKEIKKAIGPKWYQALSAPQRNALDTLETSIYQDILEGRPVRTSNIMKQLGVYPRPNNTDLMNCVYLGRDDPKQMLANLFQITYSHDFDAKRLDYPLNAKLMLSAIFYLGLDDLLKQLKKRFQPDKQPAPIENKPKPNVQPPLKSPYLQVLTAVVYMPPKKEPFKPAPLPNLDDLNEPYEEEPPPKPPVTIAIPKPVAKDVVPKKRLPISYCEKMAGIKRIEPYSSVTDMPSDTVTRPLYKSKIKKSKASTIGVQKTFGITSTKKGPRIKKPVAPTTGIQNAQYAINGVFTIHGKSFFVLGSVSILPPDGDLIHGGFKYIAGQLVNVHCGYRGRLPPPKPDPCDCIKRWHDTAIEYVKNTKCKCAHYYDYGNEGTFPSTELPYFERPTKNLPFHFNYDTIFDLDEKHLLVRKEFKRFWDTDSVVRIGDPSDMKTDKKKKKIRRASTTCLGKNPTPEDYLKCALRLMRRINIAAKLPDIHLVPELKEWMRWRIYGPMPAKEKKEMLRRSIIYWQSLLRLAQKGFGHVYPPKDETFYGHTTWEHKQKLNDKFRKFTLQYKLQLYRSYANVTNMLWATMFQAEFPDKSFREIFFSYLFARIEDLHLMRPFSLNDIMEKMIALNKNRYRCPLNVDAR